MTSLLRSLRRRYAALRGLRLGEAECKAGPEYKAGLLYSVYQYLDRDGEFDYQKYVASQVEANQRKIGCVWAQEENIEFLSSYIKRKIPNHCFGLCHGTRRGLEQQWFKKYLGCNVIGTEISETGNEFPDTIQWDFHDVKEEWIGVTDFIYSNALDHSYDPEKCLNAWASCLRDSGMIILEHSRADEKAKESDPFGAPLFVMPFLVLLWGKGSYSVRHILEAPKVTIFAGKEYLSSFLIIMKNN